MFTALYNGAKFSLESSYGIDVNSIFENSGTVYMDRGMLENAGMITNKKTGEIGINHNPENTINNKINGVITNYGIIYTGHELNNNEGALIDNKTEGRIGAGLMRPTMPRTASKLNIFEPITFPMANSCSPFKTPATEAANSGSEVPRATIVRPIVKSLTPN